MASHSGSPYKAQVAVDLPTHCPSCGNASIGVEQDNSVFCLDCKHVVGRFIDRQRQPLPNATMT